MRQPPTTQTMKISEVRGQLNTLVNHVYRKETRVVVEKSGIPVAALVSIDDLARLDQLDAERAARYAGLDRISEAFADVPVDELEREAKRAIAARRASARRVRSETAKAR